MGEPNISQPELARWWNEVGRSQLEQVLYWRWDPIGVAEDFPFSEGEYRMEADKLLPILSDGSDREGLIEHLSRADPGNAVIPRPELTKVAELILSWYPASIDHWRMLEG